MGGGDGGHQVHRPRRLAEVALADLIHSRAREGLAHPGHHLVALGRRNGRVPLDDAVAVVRPAFRDEVRPHGQRRRGPVGRKHRRDARGIVLFVGPLGPHPDFTHLVVGQRSSVHARTSQRRQVGKRGLDLRCRDHACVHLFRPCHDEQGVAFVHFGIDPHTEVEPGEGRGGGDLCGLGRDHRAPQAGPLHRHLGNVEAPFPLGAVPRLVAHHDGRAVRREARQADPAAPRLAVSLRQYDGDDPSRIAQVLPARVAADQVEELDGAEVDLLVQRVHRRDDLVVDAQPVVGLAELQLHRERAEEGRVRPAAAGVPVVPVHHVVVDRGQGARLVAVPDPLGVGDDALVRKCVPIRQGGDPAGGHADLLVVLEAVEVGAEDPDGVEGLFEEGRSVGCGGPDAVNGPVVRHFEANLADNEAQVGREHLVDRKNLMQPPEGRVNGLLGPVTRRVVPEELDDDLADLLPG